MLIMWFGKMCGTEQLVEQSGLGRKSPESRSEKFIENQLSGRINLREYRLISASFIYREHLPTTSNHPLQESTLIGSFCEPLPMVVEFLHPALKFPKD
jgi:hypothetical protein